ncbi:MAG: RES family NAD+ phosphorylase [Fimbriimonas sp.]
MLRKVREVVPADGPLVVWRLGSQEYPLYSGEGARLYGARWNYPGTPVIYTAGSLAGAIVEVLTRTGRVIPPNVFASVRILIPLDLEFEDVELGSQLGWDEPLPTNLTRDIGASWLRHNESPLLRVPSVVTRHEDNWLINPRHPRAQEINVEPEVEFRWDRRLFG